MRSRFACLSSALDLRSLCNPVPFVLWGCLGLSILVHGGLTEIGSMQSEKKTERPLTTRFVKRKPRLTKPLEMKKRPRPKRRRMQRQLVSVEAKASREQWANVIIPPQVLASLARPSSSIRRVTGFQEIGLEPHTVATAIVGTKDIEYHVDMSLEMLDIEALDTGRYQAMVVQDPKDKRNVTGFFHLIVIYSASIIDATLRMEAQGTFQYGGAYVMNIEVRKLVEAVNKYTNIKMDIAGTYTMDSPQFLKTPWVMVEVLTNFDVNNREAENIGYYLTHGGFMFAENDYFVLGNAADISLRNMCTKSLDTVGLEKGRHWNFVRIPGEHPIYHCYFDFDGPPRGHDYEYAFQSRPGGQVIPLDYLEGIFLDGPLVLILSNKDISDWWLIDPEYERKRGIGTGRDNTRQLQFGVNMIVYALTREGSITHQVMQEVR